jgi:hypothetical protein
MKVLLKFFKNNGHLRGALYFSIAFLTPIVASLENWSKTPPPNFYAVAFVVLGAFIAGLTVIRAYLDQHLSRTPDPASELAQDQPPVKATVTPEVTPPSNTPVDPTYYGIKSK